jgi:hypothetical protein
MTEAQVGVSKFRRASKGGCASMPTMNQITVSRGTATGL